MTSSFVWVRPPRADWLDGPPGAATAPDSMAIGLKPNEPPAGALEPPSAEKSMVRPPSGEGASSAAVLVSFMFRSVMSLHRMLARAAYSLGVSCHLESGGPQLGTQLPPDQLQPVGVAHIPSAADGGLTTRPRRLPEP